MLDWAVLLLAAALALLAFAGWGRLTFRLVGLPADSGVAAIWAGIASVTALVTVVHFFVPIAAPVTLAFAAIGVAGLVVGRRPADVRAFLRASAGRVVANPLPAALAALAILGCGFWAMGVPGNYDAGFYYFGSIRWLNEYAVIPGLGNLLDRFAHNESFFRIVALLNLFPLWNKGYALAGLVLLAVAAATIALSGIGRLRGGTLLLVGCAAALAFQTDNLASPAPDQAAALVAIVLFLLLLRIVTQPLREGAAPGDAALLAMLAAFAVTVKLSTAAFVLAGVLVVSPWLWQAARRSPRAALATLALCLAAAAAQVVRNVYLSGAPVFPSTFAGLWDLPWAMAPRDVQSEARWIYSWARWPLHSPNEVLASWDWLRPWLQAFPVRGWISIGGTLVLAAVHLVLLRLGRTRTADRRLLLLYAPLLAALVFWFVTAPVLRFLMPPPELALGFTAFLCFRRIDEIRPGFLPARPLLASPAAALAGVAMGLIAAMPFGRFSPAGWTPLPVISRTTFLTDSGLALSVPTGRDQCWNSELPCTGYPHKDLRLLGGGLQSGFTRKPPAPAPAPAAASP